MAKVERKVENVSRVELNKAASHRATGVRRAASNRSRSIARSKVEAGIELFGTKTGLAKYLGVSKTQPGRWIAGAEVPAAMTRRLVTDLDYVWDRITTDMGEEAAGVWLRSANPFLGGAKPLDWLKVHGPAKVIAAFDAAEAGSYP